MKKKAAGVKDEPKLSKKQQELMQAQLQKETATRARLQQVKNPVSVRRIRSLEIFFWVSHVAFLNCHVGSLNKFRGCSLACTCKSSSSLILSASQIYFLWQTSVPVCAENWFLTFRHCPSFAVYFYFDIAQVLQFLSILTLPTFFSFFLLNIAQVLQFCLICHLL